MIILPAAGEDATESHISWCAQGFIVEASMARLSAALSMSKRIKRIGRQDHTQRAQSYNTSHSEHKQATTKQ